MPTYDLGVLSDAVIGHKKPITLQQGRALRDNLLAVVTGAPGAPKIQGSAIDIGISNLSSNVAIVGLDQIASILVVATGVGTDTSGASISYRRSSDGGTTWSDPIVLASFRPGGNPDAPSDVTVSAGRIVDMVGYNAFRLSGGTGAAIAVRGV